MKASLGKKKAGKKRAAGARNSFDDEIEWKKCEIKTDDGNVYKGVVRTSRYFYKVFLDPGVVYLNKGHVIYVMPLD